MKILNVKQSVDIPDGVECSVKARTVTIKGARGSLVRSFKHLKVDIFMSDDKKTLTVGQKWYSNLNQTRQSKILITISWRNIVLFNYR